MVMLGLNETMNQLAMENSVDWYGYVLRKKVVYLLMRALDCEGEGHVTRWRLKKTLKKQVEEESVKVGFRNEDAVC